MNRKVGTDGGSVNPGEDLTNLEVIIRQDTSDEVITAFPSNRFGP
jgi:hypothetical protein